MKLNPNINIYPKILYSTGSGSIQKTSVPVFRGQTKELEIPKSEKLGVLKSLIFRKQDSSKIQEPILDDETYIIRMQRYKNKKGFAKKMNNLTYELSDMIKNNADFNDILKTAEDGVRDIRNRKDWGRRKNGIGHFDLKFYDRGCEYWKQYISLAKPDSENPIYTIKPKSNKEYPDAKTCSISYYDYEDGKITICYGSEDEKTNLDLVKKEYEKLKSNKNPSLQDINRSTATIQWLIAQETPYKRGSDSIANLLTKSIYHAYGIKVSPAKEGKSFDFEAFCRDLDDYIKIYPDIFEIPPYRV